MYLEFGLVVDDGLDKGDGVAAILIVWMRLSRGLERVVLAYSSPVSLKQA